MFKAWMLIAFILITMIVPATASAGEAHVPAQNRQGTPIYSEKADGGWSITIDGVVVTLNKSEADQLGNLINPPPPPPPKRCSDNIDNDADGLVDSNDPGCTEPDDDDESNVIAPPPQPTRQSISFNRYAQGNGGTGFDVSARRDEFIVIQGFWRRDQITTIRNANPGTKILAYKNVSRYSTPDGSGNYNTCLTTAEVTSNKFGINWSSTVVDQPDTWMKLVKPVAGSGDEYGKWCAERLLAQMNASEAAGYKVDGIFLDDSNSYSPDVDGGYPDANLNGTIDNQAQGPDALAWNAWMEAVHREISNEFRAKGIHLSANLSASVGQRNVESKGWEERQIPFFDSWLAEFTTTWPGGTAIPTMWVKEAFRLMEVSQAKKSIVLTAEPEGSSEGRQAFSLGLCLIKTEGYCSKTTGVNSTDTWYPVYDRAKALGQPTGPAASPSTDVWTRQFQNGSVRVDLNARTAIIG